MSLLASAFNPVTLAANGLSYGLTGKTLLANVADEILKRSGSNMTTADATRQAQEAIRQAIANPRPTAQSYTPQQEVGASAGPTRPNKDDLIKPTSSPMRFNEDVVSRIEPRPPAMR